MRRVIRRWGWASVLLALGCAEVWWQAGASTQELDRDKAACRAAAPDAAGFETCMAERGWWHSPYRREMQAPAAPEGARRSGTPDPAAAAVLPAAAASRAAHPASEPARAPAAKPGTAATPSRPAETTSAAAGAVPLPVAAASGGAVGSGQIFWKFGASMGELDQDQGACLEESGLRVEREAGPRWGESAGFDRCMCARGWRGGRC